MIGYNREQTTMLDDYDKRWISQQLEQTQTRLLTEFHTWASPVELRVRSHSAALRAMDVEMESLQDRVKKLEGEQ
jgi:hypothetical protein